MIKTATVAIRTGASRAPGRSIGNWLTAMSACFALGCIGEIVDPGAGPGDDTAEQDGGNQPADGGLINPPADARTTSSPDATSSARTIAHGISIAEISVYQSVKIPIVSAGAAVSQPNAPIVEGASTLIAVFCTVESGWQSRNIDAELIIENPGGTATYPTTRNVLGSSTSNVASAFRFQVDGDDITTSSRYSVTLYENNPSANYPGSTSGARFPASGTSALGAEDPHGPFHLVLVPFQYNADGSQRLPPVTGAALQEYRDRFLAMYPVAEVDVTVRNAVAYNSTIGATTGWSSWLDTLTSVREQDNPPANTFYFGIAAPAASFYAFCSNGCIAGLGWVPGRDNNYLQAAVGVSFAEDVNVYTALHEVGHTLGRSHAPCGGASNTDPSFPYSGGGVGVWGYDTVDQDLKDPNVYTDIMGYCSDQWVSDYTYEAMFERISYVNQNASFYVSTTPQQYRVALVDGAGRLEWRRYATVTRPLHGGEIEIALTEDAGGETRVTGHFFPYDHLEGGMLMVPVPSRTPVQVHAQGLQPLAW